MADFLLSILEAITKGITWVIGAIVNVVTWLFDGDNFRRLGELLDVFLCVVIILGAAFFLMSVCNKLLHFGDIKLNHKYGLPANLVHGIVTAVFVIIAVTYAMHHQFSYQDILNAFFPSDEYMRVGEAMGQSGDTWHITNVMETFMYEIANATVYIIPALIVDLIYVIVSVLCKPEENSNNGIKTILRIISVAAVYVISSSEFWMEPFKAYIVNLLINNNNILRTVLTGIPLIILMMFGVYGLFTDNNLLFILGFHFARVFVVTFLEPWQETLYIVLCFVLACVTGLILDRIEKERAEERSALFIFIRGCVCLAASIAIGCLLMLLFKNIL